MAAQNEHEEENVITGSRESERPLVLAVEGNIASGKNKFSNYCAIKPGIDVSPEPIEKWRDMIKTSKMSLTMVGYSKKNNVSEGDFTEFCKNFEFLDTTVCYQCKGFYGPNFGRPLCGLCHTYFAENYQRNSTIKRRFQFRMRKQVVQKPPVVILDASPLKAGLKLQLLPVSKNASSERLKETLREMLKHYLENFRKKKTSNRNVIEISALPVEILQKIFSNLDDFTLLTVGKVSKQWEQITASDSKQWESFTMKRWPLFRLEEKADGRTRPIDWYKIYSSLLKSCCCRTCAIAMMKNADETENIPKTAMRKRIDLDISNNTSVKGIGYIPVSENRRYWNAYITGPNDSPYEGGKFFLHIYLPLDYPFAPPKIKFLTKIIHPNVSRHGDIGLDVLKNNYCTSLNIDRMLLSIQSILCDPFTKICMEPELGRLYDQDRPRFDALARNWTKKYAMTGVI